MDEIETHLLGSIVLNPDALPEVSSRVSASDFLHTMLGRMFAMLQAMADAGQPVGDIVAVRSQLRATGLLSELGGDAFLGKLATAPVTTDSALFLAAQIRNAATKRRLRALGRRLVDAADDPTVQANDMLRSIEAVLSQVGSSSHSDVMQTIGEAMRSVVADLRRQERGYLPTGIQSIDIALGGFYRGELVVLAARPSIGKSALAAQIAHHTAARGQGVLLVSLEMSSKDLAVRQIAAALQTEVRVVRSGKLSREQVANATQLCDEHDPLPLHIAYGRSMTVSQVRGLAKLVAGYDGGLRLIVIDYLGLMAATDRRKQRWEQISEISTDLKNLAQELAVPVLACCQLTRDAEGKPPTLAQLRDTGAIEQDADVVMTLHRQTRDARKTHLDVAKCRHGATGEILLSFNPSTVQFSEYVGEEFDA